MPPCYTDLETGQRPLIPISYQGKMYIRQLVGEYPLLGFDDSTFMHTTYA